jgi:hypothetical protein
MVKINKFVMVAVLSLVLVAICGVASAATVKVDKVQVNGNYVGVPTLLDNVPGYYGYTYTLVPDGTYTVFGTITNDDKINDTFVWIGAGTKAFCEVADSFIIPAGGKKTFEFTFGAANDSDVTVGYSNGYSPIIYYDLSGIDFVDAPQSPHTVDQGPMSNAVAIYANGKLTYSGQPQFFASI